MIEPIGYHRARRHPFQVLIAAMCVVGGIPVLAGVAAPGSVAATIAPPLIYVWGGVLVVSGAMIVAAAVVKSDLTALYLEMIADPPLALSAWAFGTAALFLAGLQAIAGASIILGFGVAAATRFFQVMNTFRRVRRGLKEEGPSEGC